MAIAITTTTIAITIATTATTAITIGFDDFVLLQLHPQLTPDLRLPYTIFVHRWLTFRHTTVTVRRYIVTCVTTATPTTTARCDRLDEGYRWGAGPLGGLFNGASDLRDTL